MGLESCLRLLCDLKLSDLFSGVLGFWGFGVLGFNVLLIILKSVLTNSFLHATFI